MDQGGNKHPGPIAVYIEPWHADVFGFFELMKNIGKEEQRARDLFYTIRISDLFMKRVVAQEKCALMNALVYQTRMGMNSKLYIQNMRRKVNIVG